MHPVTRRPYVQTASDAARRAKVYLDAPGLYAITLTRGGVSVAAEVRHEPTCDPETNEPLERSWFWSLYINGELAEGPGPSITWMRFGRRIEKDEFDWLLADRQWARAHAPDSPEAQPHKRVDVSTLPPPSFE